MITGKLSPGRSIAIFRVILLLAGIFSGTWAVPGQPFTVQGPGVNPGDFRITTFATGLGFPIGMAKLPDDSLLVAVTDGTTFSGSNGRIVRLTDTNLNGVADAPAATVYTGLPGSLTALRVAGNLVLVAGDVKPITVLRRGALPSDPLTLVGQIIINYPGSRQHSASALTVRKTFGYTNRFDMFFQLGAEYNFAKTTNNISFTNSNIPGAQGVLVADAAHMLTLIDHGTSVSATNHVQIASGLRNAAGFTFHPATGDLYLQDNGIDGLINGNEPHSADELNFIARTNIGGPVEFFGYPTNYCAYRSNVVVGGAGIQPMIAFRPLPVPATGKESEGMNNVAFAPPGFPNGLNAGIFMGFHGRFNNAGVNNEENPVIFADPATTNYFHFIAGQQPGIGHLNGLITTRDSLFIADMATNGNVFSALNTGVIYQIKSLVTPTPPALSARLTGAEVRLTWERGDLQAADQLGGPWTDVADAFSPYQITTIGPRKFFRTRY